MFDFHRGTPPAAVLEAVVLEVHSDKQPPSIARHRIVALHDDESRWLVVEDQG